MPGFIIHLCIAKEYLKNHKTENEEEFISGIIAPDLTLEKEKTHYYKTNTTEMDLYEFLLNKKIDTSYNEGYFLHLFSDFLFYYKYFSGWKTMDSEILYRDYDILNKSLIKQYKITDVPTVIEEYFKRNAEGNTVEYHYDKVVQFIEEIAKYDLHQLAKDILNNKDDQFLLK